MFGYFSKKQFKILVGIKLVGLGCFNEAVEYGTGFCTIIGFDQDEILMSDAFTYLPFAMWVTSVGEAMFFLGKPVLDYACGKAVKVSLPFAFSF